MRCDGNVSLRRRGSTGLGVKTELKNMNSFKNLHDGLAYEICRQAQVLEEGGQIYQETRHWDPSAKRTIVMRVKETADDYRLFPEADLAPYDLTDEWIDGVRAKLPELPDQKAARYRPMTRVIWLSTAPPRTSSRRVWSLPAIRPPSWLSRSRTSRLTTSRRA